MTLLHREQILRIKKTAGFHVLFGEIIPFWGRYHDLIVNMLVSRLWCFLFGGKVWCEHGQPGPEKIQPRGSRWSGIQGELCKWEFRSIFFGRRTWHGFLCYLKKMTGRKILNKLSRIFRSETYFGVPIGQMSHRWNRLPRIHCWNDW